jgi:mono/diheme cytochrome c family protein
MNRNTILLGTVLLGAALCVAGEAKASRSVDELKSFYQMRCVACHGVDGSARGADGKSLKGMDFTDAKAMKGVTDEKMAKTIRGGIFFGWVMPSFKKELPDEDIALMVKEVLRKAEKSRTIEPKK